MFARDADGEETLLRILCYAVSPCRPGCRGFRVRCAAQDISIILVGDFDFANREQAFDGGSQHTEYIDGFSV